VSIYERAKRHAWLMWGVLALGFAFIVGVDQIAGHSDLAFAAAIFALVVANARILTFRCPRCGSNLFFRGPIVVPWPNRHCRRCGLDLATTR
jgi:ribosomal protein S27AE